ncbi:MAG: flippase-like domain-containing protein [Alphaproteobacteria bacterium]|nr:flippase-like domain-containing protein [Alphaproteobacteria bacterium]
MNTTATKRWIGFGLKASVTAALVWLVLRGVDLGAALERMASLSPGAAVLAVGLLISHCFVAGWRWRMVMRLFGPVLPVGTSIRLFLEGYFFNNALPSTIGGDGVRIWRATSLGLPLGASINGVLLDRVTGLTGLFILVAAGQPLLYARIEDPATRLAFAAILLAGIAGVALLILARYIPKQLIPLPLHDGIDKLSEATHAAYLHPAISLPVLGLSVIVHGVIVLSVHVIAIGLGLDVGLFESLVLVPAVILLSTLPVSIGGWGLREGLMVVALGLAGVAAEAALTVSILFGLAQIVAGLPGGALWLMAGGRAMTPTD